MRLRKYRHWGREAIIEAFQEFYSYNGRPPETFDLENVLSLPNKVTVWRAFGSLANARIESGFQPGLVGRGGAGRGGGWGNKPMLSSEQRRVRRAYLKEWRQNMRQIYDVKNGYGHYKKGQGGGKI